MQSLRLPRFLSALFAFFLGAHFALAQQKEVIPHAQDKPPGPPLSPQEAVKKMTVPEGFSVEIVAAEPDIVNPVAMTFDERGRIWLTESLEYPRRRAGPGKDRVKVLEDTDGDGRADKFTVFADGLNIPSGIAVGYGGVWVANSPDILFLQDTDGDGRVDKQKVVVTGFGRSDTHELPNSLTWGPDGWLYGLNGVFNHSHVRYAKDNPNYDAKHPGWPLTCAMFRIHPRTWEFQVFAEGTSNPWGIAFNEDGEAFVSACVIDHLWHITETGYYHRQGGPYPPHTWKIDSIVKHKHQKAAYCGITWFDSDAYPEKYRGLLYMGNIHGGCINVDRLKRDGSTYFATPEPDFLTANDAWFMPVVQKTGPDGCLYILDWYDRYHCYQDANRDPAGIDRLKGRLYRVRYKDTLRAGKFDLAKETSGELIERLGSPNVYVRETAQRLLQERNDEATWSALQRTMYDEKASTTKRRHAFFALIGMPRPKKYPWPSVGVARRTDTTLDSWSQRAQFDDPEMRNQAAKEFPKIDFGREFARSPRAMPPEVLLQFAIGISKLPYCRGQFDAWLAALVQSRDDALLPRIIWQNIHPRLEDHADDFLSVLQDGGYIKHKPVADLMPRVVERLLDRRNRDPKPVASLFTMLLDGPATNQGAAGLCLSQLTTRVQNGEITGDDLARLKEMLEPRLKRVLDGPVDSRVFLDAALLAATWKSAAGIEGARRVFRSVDARFPNDVRVRALGALIAANAQFLEHDIDEALAHNNPSEEFRGQLLASLGRLNKSFVADIVLRNYDSLEPSNRPKAIEMLTQRPLWAKRLLEAVKSKQLAASLLNENQVRRLLSFKDEELTKLVTKTWGTLRTERDPQRELFVDRMRYYLRRHPGDATRGWAAYNKVCGQCHKLHGQGQEVGPDITLNGRSSFEQLLSNVFDPSLVIGADYQARTVITADGRSLTGLLVEDSPQRVVLKTQGGKLETVARGDVEQFAVSKLSMMPEGVEKLLTAQELADLFALLTLDKHPSDKSAKRLPDVCDVTPQQNSDPAKFDRLLAEVAPGFSVKTSGEGGVALLREHAGRKIVVRTHPPKRGESCVLRSKVSIPKGQRTRLLLAVSHDPRGDWQLVVKAGGQSVHESLIGPKTTKNGWADVTVDLSPYAGREVLLELENRPTGWEWEFGYWAGVELVSEP